MALERINDASDLDELQAAWGQTQVEHSQAGVQIPEALQARFDERVLELTDDERDEWLADYDGG